MASDEVTDGIAAIEMHRQGTEKESGLAVSVSEALRKLQELLAQEKEALQLGSVESAPGADSVLVLNVEAVANEIKRVQSMGGGKGPRPVSNNARPRDRQLPRPEKAHNAPRNRGRRTMGRTGGRGGGGGGGSGGGGGGGGGPGGPGGR
jgi:hypothetical protein